MTDDSQNLTGHVNSSRNGRDGLIKMLFGVAQAIIILMLAWIGGTTLNHSERLATIEAKLEVKTEDRYRGSDARRDFANVENKFDDIKRRLENVERKH